jgi:hypothetical protein
MTVSGACGRADSYRFLYHPQRQKLPAKPTTPLPYAQLLKYIIPHRRTLLTVVTLLLAGTAVTLVNPLIAGKMSYFELPRLARSAFRHR